MGKKYVIFKIEDWNSWLDRDSNWRDTMEGDGPALPTAITDGTVIRTQDAFAASGLQSYADSIAVAIDAVQDLVPKPWSPEMAKKVSNMRIAADHFHEQAEIARDTKGKVPD
jgi:hypothetical protein